MGEVVGLDVGCESGVRVPGWDRLDSVLRGCEELRLKGWLTLLWPSISKRLREAVSAAARCRAGTCHAC